MMVCECRKIAEDTEEDILIDRGTQNVFNFVKTQWTAEMKGACPNYLILSAVVILWARQPCGQGYATYASLPLEIKLLFAWITACRFDHKFLEVSSKKGKGMTVLDPSDCASCRVNGKKSLPSRTWPSVQPQAHQQSFMGGNMHMVPTLQMTARSHSLRLKMATLHIPHEECTWCAQNMFLLK